LFRRTDKADPTPTATPTLTDKGGGKGRPTPSRKEAEAAARQRAKAAGDSKAARKLAREKRMAQQNKIREGLKSGDERYLPARDQGPVKKFVRTWVDSRLSFAEILLPLLFVLMFMIYSSNRQLVDFGNRLWTTTILITVVDTLWLNFRLKRALRAKFPDESLKGTTTYALLRVLQPRFMRLPKPQVKIGGRPKTPKGR
jgi:hypothetical protein